MSIPKRNGPSPEVRKACEGSYRLLLALICLGAAVFFGNWVYEIVARFL